MAKKKKGFWGIAIDEVFNMTPPKRSFTTEEDVIALIKKYNKKK